MKSAEEIFDESLEHHQQGRLAEAEAGYRAALAVEAGHAGATHFLGVLARQTGRGREGLELIERSVRLAPERGQYHYHLGKALDEDGRLEEAEGAYRRAIAQAPRSPLPQTNLGLLLQTLGRLEEAVAALERAVELEPDHAEWRFNLARAYEAGDRPMEAVIQLRDAVERDGGVRALVWLAGALRRCGQRADAVDAARQATEAAPEDTEAWLELGRGRQEAGDLRAAGEAYRKVLALDAAHPTAPFYLAAATGATPTSAPPALIRQMYDGLADHFDRHLEGRLKYATPRKLHGLVAQFLRRADAGLTPPLAILDAGCGTGLAAPLFKPLAGALIGADLSPGMLRQARARGLYTELLEGDLTAIMAARPGGFDLIVAADVLICMGDLAPVLAAAAVALRPGGVLACSVEAHEGEGFALRPSRRFAHSLEYLRQTARQAGFAERLHETAELREEEGHGVMGHLMILQRERA